MSSNHHSLLFDNNLRRKDGTNCKNPQEMAPSNSSRRSCRSAQALLSWTTTTRTIDEWRKLEFNEILKLKLLTNWDSSVQLCFPYYLPASIYLIHVNSTSILYFPFSSCIDQCIPRSNHMQRVSRSTSGITARRSSASCSRSGKAEPAWVVVVATTDSNRKALEKPCLAQRPHHLDFGQKSLSPHESDFHGKKWRALTWAEVKKNWRNNNKWNTASLHVAASGTIRRTAETRPRKSLSWCCAGASSSHSIQMNGLTILEVKSSKKTPVVQPENTKLRVCFLCMGLLVLFRSRKIRQFSALKGILQKHKACI